MYVERHDISLTTNASGAATGYTPVITGKIVNVIYTPSATVAFDNTADITVTLEATSQAVLSQSNVSAAFNKAPRQAAHDEAGAALLYAAGGKPLVDHIYAAKDRVKVVVAEGGNTKSGVVTIVVA